MNLKDYYPILRDKNYGNLWKEKIWEHIQSQQLLKEFITKTINVEKTIELFKKRFSDIEIDLNSYNDIVISLNKTKTKYLKEIESFMDAYGYFLSNVSFKRGKINIDQILAYLDYQNDNFSYRLIYKAKYDIKINIKDEEIYYHLVPDIYIDKIRRYGLTPKSKSKIANHPERIYLQIKLEKDFAEDLYFAIDNPSTKKLIKNYYILKILGKDLNKLKINVYKDPDYNNGVWTYQNIPPDIIYILKNKIQVNENNT